MRRLLLLTLFIPVLALTGIASASGVTLNLVVFSAPKPIVQTLIPKFQNTPNGNGVNFTQSYGPSSSQAQAIIAGQPASIAFLSNALDVNSLVNANLVVKNWTKKLPQARHGRELGRGVRRAPRQSEGHSHLGRPDEAGRPDHHAEPVPVGRREVERPRHLRRAADEGQDRRPGDEVRQVGVPARRLAAVVGVPLDGGVPRRPG